MGPKTKLESSPIKTNKSSYSKEEPKLDLNEYQGNPDQHETTTVFVQGMARHGLVVKEVGDSHALKVNAILDFQLKLRDTNSTNQA